MLAHLATGKWILRVQEVLGEASAGTFAVYCSLINLRKVTFIIERECGLSRAQASLGLIDQLPMEILPASMEAVLAAAHVKAGHSLSYADAFAVAAAQELRAVILIGHPEFDSVREDVRVEPI